MVKVSQVNSAYCKNWTCILIRREYYLKLFFLSNNLVASLPHYKCVELGQSLNSDPYTPIFIELSTELQLQDKPIFF